MVIYRFRVARPRQDLTLARYPMALLRDRAYPLSFSPWSELPSQEGRLLFGHLSDRRAPVDRMTYRFVGLKAPYSASFPLASRVPFVGDRHSVYHSASHLPQASHRDAEAMGVPLSPAPARHSLGWAAFCVRSESADAGRSREPIVSGLSAGRIDEASGRIQIQDLVPMRMFAFLDGLAVLLRQGFHLVRRPAHLTRLSAGASRLARQGVLSRLLRFAGARMRASVLSQLVRTRHRAGQELQVGRLVGGPVELARLVARLQLADAGTKGFRPVLEWRFVSALLSHARARWRALEVLRLGWGDNRRYRLLVRSFVVSATRPFVRPILLTLHAYGSGFRERLGLVVRMVRRSERKTTWALGRHEILRGQRAIVRAVRLSALGRVDRRFVAIGFIPAIFRAIRGVDRRAFAIRIGRVDRAIEHLARLPRIVLAHRGIDLRAYLNWLSVRAWYQEVRRFLVVPAYEHRPIVADRGTARRSRWSVLPIRALRGLDRKVFRVGPGRVIRAVGLPAFLYRLRQRGVRSHLVPARINLVAALILRRLRQSFESLQPIRAIRFATPDLFMFRPLRGLRQRWYAGDGRPRWRLGRLERKRPAMSVPPLVRGYDDRRWPIWMPSFPEVGVNVSAQNRPIYGLPRWIVAPPTDEEWLDLWRYYREGVDRLIVPGTDHPYSEEAIFDPQTGEPHRPLSPTNVPDVKIEAPTRHPWPEWSSWATQTIDVDLGALVTIMLGVRTYLVNHEKELPNQSPYEALSGVLRYLASAIEPYGDAALRRAFRHARWYAESIVLRYGDLVLSRRYDPWVGVPPFRSPVHNQGFVIHSDGRWEAQAPAQASFDLTNRIDGHLYLSVEVGPGSQARLIVDGQEVASWDTSYVGFTWWIPAGPHTFSIVADASPDAPVVISGLVVEGVHFAGAEMRFTPNTRDGHLAVIDLLHMLMAYYELHHIRKTKGTRRRWLGLG